MVANITVEDGRAYSISETCKLLGIHRNTLRRYTKDGRIASETREFDGRTLYRGAEIKRIVLTTI